MESTAQVQEPAAGGRPAVHPSSQEEVFLQHALGTRGDVRIAAFLLSFVVALAVIAAGIRLLRRRRGQATGIEPDQRQP